MIAVRGFLSLTVAYGPSVLAAQELCEGQPEEYLTFLEYARSLEFDQKPDYDFLRSLFRDLADTKGGGTRKVDVEALRRGHYDQSSPPVKARVVVSPVNQDSCSVCTQDHVSLVEESAI